MSKRPKNNAEPSFVQLAHVSRLGRLNHEDQRKKEAVLCFRAKSLVRGSTPPPPRHFLRLVHPARLDYACGPSP